jgi:ribosomal protein S18 acetylase RimI-like enzyme
MRDTIVREMVRRDLPQILSLSRDNMAPIIFSSWGVDYRDEDVMRLILEPSAYTEVLEREGEVVGYYSVNIGADNLFVNSIQVRKGYQNRGLGTAMMARIESIARSRGVGAIELWVQITNRPAIVFYRRRGYRTVSRQGNNYLMRQLVERYGDEEAARPLIDHGLVGRPTQH